MPDFSAIKESFKHSKEYFLNDVKDFFIFCIVAILGTLIFYRQTQDELTATIVITTLWVFFWRESDTLGKVFLVSASLIGYVHELIGVQAGYFTYLGGFFGGVPLWILSGYGVIFWASYHFWTIFEKTYVSGSAGARLGALLRRTITESWQNVIALTSILFALDILFFGFTKKPVTFFIEFLLVTALWRAPKDIILAYFVAFFTVFDEFAGEVLGVWSHDVFSLVSLATSYMFLLWMAKTITDLLKRTKIWMPREMLGASGFFVLFLVNTYLRINGHGGW